MRAIIENMNSPDCVLYTLSSGSFQGKIKVFEIWKITNYNFQGRRPGGVHNYRKTKGRSGMLHLVRWDFKVDLSIFTLSHHDRSTAEVAAC